MKVHVTVSAGTLKLFDEVIEAATTGEALRRILKKPGVVEHLQDLKAAELKAEAWEVGGKAEIEKRKAEPPEGGTTMPEEEGRVAA